MIKHETWKLSALRSLHRSGRLRIKPSYQREVTSSPALRKSLLESAKHDGALPVGLVLRDVRVETNNFDYEVIDGRRRCEVLVDESNIFPHDTIIPIAIYPDYKFEQARKLYEKLNDTGLKHSTGEFLKAALAHRQTATSLKRFVENPIWSIYNKDRFGGLRHALMYFTEAHNVKSRTKKELTQFVREFKEDDVNLEACQEMLDTISKLQSVVQQASTLVTKANVRANTCWPLAWMYQAVKANPELGQKSTSKLATQLSKWIDAHPGINTSQPLHSSVLNTIPMNNLLSVLRTA